MPTQKLTQRFVDALPPSGKLTLYFDESMKGFGVYTTANAKTYFIQARVNGKEKKRSIGKASLMKLDAARTEAREILALMAKGVDPVEEEKKHQLCSLTLSQAFERYCSTRSLKPGTIATYKKFFRLYLTVDSVQLHPQKAKLAEEVGLIRDQLAHLLQEREELVSVVMPSLEALYYVLIGKYQYDCFCLECEVRRIRRKIEMIQGALNRMELVDLVQIEASLDIEQSSWKKLIDDMAVKIELAKEWAEAETLSVQAEKELKKLYYELAKKAHPDIHQNQSERLNSIWLQIVSAYKSGNLEGMKALALLLEDDTEDLYALSTDILESKREQLKKQMDQLAQVVTSLQQTFPYTIKDQVEDPNWVNTQVSDFLEKQKTLSQQQEQLLVMLASLVSGLAHDTQSHSH